MMRTMEILFWLSIGLVGMPTWLTLRPCAHWRKLWLQECLKFERDTIPLMSLR
jgi:hypothetical protein